MDRYYTGPWFDASARPEPAPHIDRAAMAVAAVESARDWIATHRLEIGRVKRELTASELLRFAALPALTARLMPVHVCPPVERERLDRASFNLPVQQRVTTLAVPGAPNTTPYALTGVGCAAA